jgi:hypothetical protein
MLDAFLEIRIIKRRDRLQLVSDVQLSDAVFLVSFTIFYKDLWCAYFSFLKQGCKFQTIYLTLRSSN